MADNTTLNTGSGGDVVRTQDRSSVKTPVVVLDLGSDSAESLVDGTAAAPAALMPVGGKTVRVVQTPTVSAASAYAIKDAVGGLLTFANAARVSGGSIIIEAATILDLDRQMAVMDLVLFDQTFTATSDNAAFDPSDADLANVIGVISFNQWADFNDNAIASRSGLGFAAKLAGTSLFGQLVTRSAPTYNSTSDITVILHITQN